MKRRLKNFFKRLGFVGFLFFLIKGIIWTLIFLGLGNWLVDLFA
jgi:lipopolysaccharide export LptBFGC system permease protein LptF